MKSNRINTFSKVQRTNNVCKLQSASFTNHPEFIQFNDPRNLRRFQLTNQLKLEIQKKSNHLVLRPVDHYPDEEYNKARKGNWQLQQDLLKFINETCDSLESIPSNTYLNKIEISESDDLSAKYVEDKKAIFKNFNNLMECREMIFDFFSGSLTPAYLPFSYGVEFLDLLELLSSKGEGCSEEEVEWLKLLNVTHCWNWLDLDQAIKDESKQWREDFYKDRVGCDLIGWTKLFFRLNKVEANLMDSFSETLNYYSKRKVVAQRDINFILNKCLKSLKNASLLRNAVKKSTNLIRCMRAFQPSRWPEDCNKSSILLRYLYLLQREYDFQGELCPIDDQDKLVLINDFFLSLLPRRDQIEDQIKDEELVDEFNSLILSHMKEPLYRRICEFIRKIPIPMAHRYWDSIDLTSSDSKSFFKNFGICIDEKEITISWNRLMELIISVAKDSYLLRVINYSSGTWLGRYPSRNEVSEVRLTVLGVTSSEEVNLSYRKFLTLGHGLLSPNSDKQNELSDFLKSENFSTLGKEEKGLKDFLNGELNFCKQRDAISSNLESALKEDDERSRINHDDSHESSEDQRVDNVHIGNDKRLSGELGRYIALSILAMLIILLIAYYLS